MKTPEDGSGEKSRPDLLHNHFNGGNNRRPIRRVVTIKNFVYPRLSRHQPVHYKYLLHRIKSG